MESTNKLVVVPLQELFAILEEIFIKFRDQTNTPYYSHQSDNTKIYTRYEVAKILKKSPNTVTKLIRQKKLHASVFNRQYYINHAELMKFINHQSKC
ncbi:hypothetical protein CAP35_06460 [Chitinophagaceae bacterium IBVUCB1]|nr:hypothetical protein CAP35_06460 [Chitinophagaceae bacterium IBVUCB1]